MSIDLTRGEIMLKGAAAMLAAAGLRAAPGGAHTTASNRSEVQALLESWSDAARTKDIERLMSLYSADVVSFDVGPPLEHAGSAAVRGNFVRWFEMYKDAIALDIREADILTSGDIAVAHTLIRASGTLKDGRSVEYGVRATVCWERSDHRWLITHEHVSLPVDLTSRQAVMDVVP